MPKLSDLIGGKIVSIERRSVDYEEEGCASMEGCEIVEITVEKDGRKYLLKIISWDFEGYMSGLDTEVELIE